MRPCCSEPFPCLCSLLIPWVCLEDTESVTPQPWTPHLPREPFFGGKFCLRRKNTKPELNCSSQG